MNRSTTTHNNNSFGNPSPLSELGARPQRRMGLHWVVRLVAVMVVFAVAIFVTVLFFGPKGGVRDGAVAQGDTVESTAITAPAPALAPSP